MRGRGLVMALAAGSVAWFALIVLAPRLPPVLGAVVYAFGALVCHQRPERSFHWDGAQLAVCARCTGIYLGACVTAVLVFVPPRRYVRQVADARGLKRWGVAAALPTLVTVGAEWAGWWQPSATTRALAGIVIGGAAGLVVAAALHYNECLPRAAAPRPPQTRI